MRVLAESKKENAIHVSICKECSQMIWKMFESSGVLLETSPYKFILEHYYFEHPELYFVLKNSEEKLMWLHHSGEYKKCMPALEEIKRQAERRNK